jgi:hypothetical protein
MLRQRHFLNVIKYLGSELQIPIVAVGTHGAFNAISNRPSTVVQSLRAGVAVALDAAHTLVRVNAGRSSAPATISS